MEIQKSPTLFQNLKNIKIRGTQDIALFKIAHDAIMELGELEHTGDWDPHLIIELHSTKGIDNLNDNSTCLDEIIFSNKLETATGYSYITFGDFNDEDNKTPLLHHQEITNILIECQDPNDDENTITIQIPIKNIKSITLER